MTDEKRPEVNAAERGTPNQANIRDIPPVRPSDSLRVAMRKKTPPVPSSQRSGWRKPSTSALPRRYIAVAPVTERSGVVRAPATPETIASALCHTTKNTRTVTSHTHPANTLVSASRRRSTGNVQRKAGPKRRCVRQMADGNRKEMHATPVHSSESNHVDAFP